MVAAVRRLCCLFSFTDFPLIRVLCVQRSDHSWITELPNFRTPRVNVVLDSEAPGEVWSRVLSRQQNF